MTRRLRHRSCSDGGETLVEIMVAIVIIGITVVPLLGSLIETIDGSVEHRALATIDTLLRSFAETATSEIEVSPTSGTAFTPCSTSYSLLSTPSPASGPAGTAVTVFGTGFSASASLSSFTASLGGTSLTTANGGISTAQSQASSDGNGNMQVTFWVPSGLTAGTTYPVTLAGPGSSGGVTDSGTAFGATAAQAAVAPVATSPDAGYTMGIQSIQYWNAAAGALQATSQSSCQSNAELDASGVQVVTLGATAPGSGDTLSFAVRNPADAPPPVPTPQVVVAANPASSTVPGSGSTTVTFTATVTPAAANPAPSGTITWSSNPGFCPTTPEAVTPGSGNTATATCTLTLTPSNTGGIYTATATYNGDAYNTVATGSGSETVYAADGSGTMTVSPSTVNPSSTGNVLTFTYTAAAGGIAGGEVDLTVPPGWTAPQSTSSSAAGYTVASSGSVSVSGSTVKTVKVTNLTLAGTASFTITYGSGGGLAGVMAPVAHGTYQFPTQEMSTGTGTLTLLAASPSVVVGGPSQTTFTAVAYAGGNNTAVWAVGDGCTVVYTDATQAWTTLAAPSGCNNSTLAGVFIQGAGDGWAVGSGGTVLICSANCQAPASGATWTASSGSTIPSTVNLTGVWAASASLVYAVGTTSTGAGKIYSCTSSCTAASAAWTDITPPQLGSTALTGVSGANNEVIAVGASGTVLVCSQSTCTGASGSNTWAQLASNNQNVTSTATLTSGSATITDVALFNGSADYVGYNVADTTTGHSNYIGNNSTIVSENNSTGTAVMSNTASNVSPSPASDSILLTLAQSIPSGTPNLTGVDVADSNDIYVVGAGGVWGCSSNSCTTTLWTAFATSTSLNAVAASGSSPAWAVGNAGTVLSCSSNCDKSTGVWTSEAATATSTTNNVAPTTAALFGVDNNGTTDVWAAGASGTIIATTNTTSSIWGPQNMPSTQSLDAVAYAGGSNTAVWAVGGGCTVLYSSVLRAWTTFAAPSGCNNSNLAGVFIQGASDGWAVGSGGTVLICSLNCQTPASGATWTASTGSTIPSTVNLSAVWGASATLVYAVGTTSTGGGQIWSCTASCTSVSAAWTNITPPQLGSTALDGVSGANGEVMAVGASGTVLVCTQSTCTGGASGSNTWAQLASNNQNVTTTASLTSGSATITDSSLFTGPADYVGYTVADTTTSHSNYLNNTSILSENNSTGTAVLSNKASNFSPSPASDSILLKVTGSIPTGSPNLTDVDVAASNDVYVVGAGGVWGCSSNSCTTTPWTAFATSTSLNDVTANGSSNAWAVGNSGTVLYCSSSCDSTGVWTSQAATTSWTTNNEAPTSASLFGVADDGTTVVWAVGASGTIIATDNSTSSIWGPQPP